MEAGGPGALPSLTSGLRHPATAKRRRRKGGAGMAGRAAYRATLAAPPAQAVPLPSVSASSPRHRHSMQTARTFAALSFADPGRCSRFDLMECGDTLSPQDHVTRGQVDDDCPGGARVRPEPPSVLAADQDLFGRWQAVVTFGRARRHGQARRHATENEAGLSRCFLGDGREPLLAARAPLPQKRDARNASAATLRKLHLRFSGGLTHVG